jgi:hypothetical protein
MKKKSIFLVLLLLSCSAITILADPPTPAPAPNGSAILTRMNIEVDKSIDTLHLISTDNDPDILTKTYVLKHADPYELRPYLRSAAGSERINGMNDFVSCLKYKDGTGIIIVSAEDYKFDRDELKKHGVSDEDCMCIDDIVAALDQPNITSSSGEPKFMYFPECRSAQEIAQLIRNVGLNLPGDHTELQRGGDAFTIDPGLNSLVFLVNPYHLENIYNKLRVYDQPLPEVRVKVKVYELDYENDGKVGVDFQAWKNGPGSDLFSVSARFGQGMNPAGFATAANWSSAKVIHLSPRWNTRFLDFLEARSKANVMIEGTLNIRNNTQGVLENMVGVPNFTDGNAVANNAYFDYEDLHGIWVPWNTAVPGSVNSETMYSFVMYDTQGTPITISAYTTGTTLRFTRVTNTNDSRTLYTVQILDGGGFLIKDGKNMGGKVNGYNLSILTAPVTSPAGSPWMPYTNNWNNDHTLTNIKNFQRDTQISNYGFRMSIIPSICSDTTTLNINMQNTSLIGFTENANGAAGAARTMNSEVNTTVMVNNFNKKFIIGGLEKTARVRSVSKVPWLGSLPLLGFIFSSESEVTKKSQLVAVVECEQQTPVQVMHASFKDAIKVIDEAHEDVGKGNSYGFDQFLLDKDKTSLDKLP